MPIGIMYSVTFWPLKNQYLEYKQAILLQQVLLHFLGNLVLLS